MSLPRKYELLFRGECDRLSSKICDSISKLKQKPDDLIEIKKLVQTADTIMGDARFLEDKTLEDYATMIVKEFSDVDDVRKIDQLTNVIMDRINN